MEWMGLGAQPRYRAEDDELREFDEDDDEEEEVVLRHPSSSFYRAPATSTSSSSNLNLKPQPQPQPKPHLAPSSSTSLTSSSSRPPYRPPQPSSSGAPPRPHHEGGERGGHRGRGGGGAGRPPGGGGVRPRSVSSSLADLRAAAAAPPMMPTLTTTAPVFAPRLAKDVGAVFAAVLTPSVRNELDFCRYHFEERRGDGPQVEMEDATQAIHTIHRELDSCADLVGDVLGEITQQVHNISCMIGMQLLKASANQSKYEAESRQRQEEDAEVKVEFMKGIEEERRKIDIEFNDDVIRLEAMHRVMAISD